MARTSDVVPPPASAYVDSAFVDFVAVGSVTADSAIAAVGFAIADFVSVVADFVFAAVGSVIFGCAATDVVAIHFGFVAGHSPYIVRCYSRPNTRYNRVKLADRCSPAGIQARRFPNVVH